MAGRLNAQVQRAPLCGLSGSVKIVDCGTRDPRLDCLAFVRIQCIPLEDHGLAFIEQYGLQMLHASQGGYAL